MCKELAFLAIVLIDTGKNIFSMWSMRSFKVYLLLESSNVNSHQHISFGHISAPLCLLLCTDTGTTVTLRATRGNTIKPCSSGTSWQPKWPSLLSWRWYNTQIVINNYHSQWGDFLCVLILPLQHIVFVVKFFVAWMIPDVPSDVKARIKRERYLIQEYLHNYEVEKLKLQLSHSFITEPLSEMSMTLDKHEVLSECL